MSQPSPQQKGAETKLRRTRARAIKATDKLLRKSKPSDPVPRMEKIAEEAEMGVATLYKTFGSRDRLFVETFKEMILKPLEEEAERFDDPEMARSTRLRLYFEALSKSAKGGRLKLYQAVMVSRIENPSAALGADVDYLDTDMVTEVVAKNIQQLCRPTIWAFDDMTEMLADSLLTMLARGGKLNTEVLAMSVNHWWKMTNLDHQLTDRTLILTTADLIMEGLHRLNTSDTGVNWTDTDIRGVGPNPIISEKPDLAKSIVLG